MRLLITLLLLTICLSVPAFAQKTDREGVEETLRNYMDGGTYGDTSRMAKVFHPSATMKYINKQTGQFTNVPIADYLARGKASAGKKTDRQTRILAVDIVGTAAQAKLELDYPAFQFIDLFNLLKIDSTWLVVSKLFYRVDKAPLVAKDTISTGDVFGLTVAPDRQRAYFVRSYGGRDSLHLYTTDRQNGRWNKPRKAPFSGTHKDIDPAFTPDGTALLFNSDRPRPGKSAAADFDIWAIRKTGNAWSDPYHLGPVVNSDSSDFYATATASNTIYFTSNRKGGLGTTDIWRSVFRNGAYQTPENVGSPINTPGDESNPCISPQEDYLIFSSRRPDSFGDSDLYISFNLNGRWTKPQHFGPDLNTPDAEFAPTLTADHTGGVAKTLYFSRIRRGKPLVENIYVIENVDKFIEPMRRAANGSQ